MASLLGKSFKIQSTASDTSGVQFRVGYDGSNKADFSVSSGGDLTIAPSGGDTNVTGKLSLNNSGLATYFYGNASTSLRPLTITTSSTDNNGDTHTFNVSSISGVIAFATNGFEHLRIDKDGNVGIGDSSPSYKLDVNGTARVTGATTLDSTLTVAGDANFDSGTLFVDVSTNRVGVGTTSPDDLVNTVFTNDGSASGGITLRNTGTSNNTGATLSFKTATNDTKAQISGLRTTLNYGKLLLYAYGSTTNANSRIYIGTETGNNQKGMITFETGDDSITERMRIASDGKVGIATSSPATTLDVSGDVTITDKIIHSGDTNTAIRFPAASTVGIEATTFRITAPSSGANGLTMKSGRAKTGNVNHFVQNFLDTSDNILAGYSVRTANSNGSFYFFTEDTSDTGSANTASFIFDDSSNLTIKGGNLILSNGNGIDFSATPGTGTSELLDDYEEGTWTPTYGGSVSDPSCTHDFQDGKYTKIGNIVHISCGIGTDAASGGSGDLLINGLPFTSAADCYASSSNGVNYDFSSAVNPNAYIAPSTNYITFVTNDNTAGITSVSVLKNASNDNRLFFSITYTAA